MSIDQADPRLTAYVFGELSAEEKAAFEAELAHDESARAALAEIQSTVAALRSDFSTTKPHVLEPERRKQVEHVVAEPRRKARRRMLWGAASFASAAAVAFLVSTTITGERQPAENALHETAVPQEVQAVEKPAQTAAAREVEATPLALPGLGPLPSPAVAAAAPAARRNSLPQRELGFGDSGFAASKPQSSFTDRTLSDARPPRPSVQRNSSAEPAPMAGPSVSAGEWDDNANYREFMRWVGTAPAAGAHGIDVRDRRFVVVRDPAGLGVPGCRVIVEDENDRQTQLWTTASGRAILFPHAEGLTGRTLTATTDCAGGASKAFSLGGADGIVDLRTSERRILPAEQIIDVAFILDSTGSMSEEIAAVKTTIQKVASGLRSSNVRIRMGLVEFKDRGDPFVTRIFPMSTNLERFSAEVAAVRADGGGDTPESANEALHVGIQQLAWNDAALAKLAFLVGDAPPHLDYPQDYDYALEARAAAHRGIQVYTIAASGMDTLGQFVWRQVAQYTGATNLFVLRGGAGPQSVGAGDPKSSCGGTQTAYTSGNLDQLVLAKIKGAIRALERDPMRIPGLNTDENAKPCADRIQLAQ